MVFISCKFYKLIKNYIYYFGSASSDSEVSESDESSEAEFRPPVGLKVKAARRRMKLRSSPRKCHLSLRKSLRTSPRKYSLNSPSKQVQDSSPSKLIRRTQKPAESKTPINNLKKSPCNTENQNKMSCKSPVSGHSTKFDSKFLRTPKRKIPQHIENIQNVDISNNLNNARSPLKLKERSAKCYLSEFDNESIVKKRYSHNSLLGSSGAASPLIGPLIKKKRRSTVSIGKLYELDEKVLCLSLINLLKN